MAPIDEIPGYRMGELLHESNRSLVYRADRLTDDRSVIVKVHAEHQPEPRDLGKFRREFEIYRLLNFPGVLQALALEPLGTRLALITEDFGGVSLESYMRTFRWDRAGFLEIAIGLAEILGQVHHRQYIHKDIKPANILIHPQTRALKIIDFDIASPLLRESWEARDSQKQEGTPRYMSPEQWSGRSLDYRTDFYSLGITLYELAAGKAPFEFEDVAQYNHAHTAIQPPAPTEINSNIGPDLSAILLKLISKDPEDRYQSGFGLAADLRLCAEQPKGTDFTPGQGDFSEVFQIPDKLYGRESEIALLDQAVRQTGGTHSRLVIVKGGSGIGKSTLVEMLKQKVIQQGGHFLTGKFDQYRRNIPYSSLIQAFREMIAAILAEPSRELDRWRERIQTALGPNGRIILDVLPELAHVIGEQPPVARLGPAEAENRFQITFDSFIGSLCSTEQPLVLFMDDLQWTDEASLKLLGKLMSSPENRGILIGSYRDSEVDRYHPVTFLLNELIAAGRPPEVIELKPLSVPQVNQLVSETLRQDANRTAKLAAHVHEKTGGTPFFVAEFMKALHALGLIAFDPDIRDWRWKLDEIEQEIMADNVVELMSWNIEKLSADAREIIMLASCIGNQFDLRNLSIVSEKSPVIVARHLGEALRAGLLVPQGEDYRISEVTHEFNKDNPLEVSYRFLHDRVQQAAYGVLGAAERKQVHLRIGRILLKQYSEDELDEEIFAVAGHWNAGLDLLSDDRERWTAIDLNQRAGRKARESTAYSGAVNYFSTAYELLPADAWQSRYKETLSLVTDFAEAETLNSHYESADRLADEAILKSRTALDRVAPFEVRIRALNARNLQTEALANCRDILKQLRIRLPERPTFRHVFLSYLRTKWTIMRRGGPESLLKASDIKDERIIAVTRLLTYVFSSAYQTNFNLFGLITTIITRLAYQYGFTGSAAHIVAAFGIVQSGVFENYDASMRFGKIALELMERPESRQGRCRAMMIHYAFIHHWKAPISECIAGQREAARAGFEIGDVEYATYSLMFRGMSLLLGDESLDDIAEYFRKARGQIEPFQDEQTRTLINIWSQLIENLQGRVRRTTVLTGDVMDETSVLATLREVNYESGLCFVYYCRGLLALLADDLATCLNNVEAARKIEYSIQGMQILPHLVWIESLVRLRLCDETGSGRAEHLSRVEANQRRFQKWTGHAPFNQEHRFLLIEAEHHRIMNRQERAAQLFRKSSSQVTRGGYLVDSILIHERAATYFNATGDAENAAEFRRAALDAARSLGCPFVIERLRTGIVSE